MTTSIVEINDHYVTSYVLVTLILLLHVSSDMSVYLIYIADSHIIIAMVSPPHLVQASMLVLGLRTPHFGACHLIPQYNVLISLFVS